MHVSLRAEIAEKIAKQQQLTYTMGLKLYRSRIKKKIESSFTFSRFNEYVDKKGLLGGPKMSILVHV